MQKLVKTVSLWLEMEVEYCVDTHRRCESEFYDDPTDIDHGDGKEEGMKIVKESGVVAVVKKEERSPSTSRETVVEDNPCIKEAVLNDSM